jgi:hypothetical protein
MQSWLPFLFPVVDKSDCKAFCQKKIWLQGLMMQWLVFLHFLSLKCVSCAYVRAKQTIT